MNEGQEKDNQQLAEFDMTSSDLVGLQEMLTREIQNANVLHGSFRGDIHIINPFYGIDTIKGDATGVFATDQPLIALAKAAAGSRLKLWTRHILFGVDTLEEPFNPNSYIYVIPKAHFVPTTEDPSEYISHEPVEARKRIKFNTDIIVPFFRNIDAALEVIDPISGDIKSELIQSSDMISGLLTVKNLLELVGPINYLFEVNSENFDRFSRMEKILTMIRPVIQKIPESANENIQSLSKMVYELYKINTGGIYDTVPYIQDTYIKIDTTMRLLKRT